MRVRTTPIVAILVSILALGLTERTFKIDYENHQFLKDGKPFRYISGEIHYFRIPPELWQDRLMRLRHAGLNAIQVYVPWNVHETFEGHFDFSGQANLTEFFRIAQENELYVLLRPGPYICAEFENGGLPYWLLKKDGIQLRLYNEPFIQTITNYFNRLLPLIRPLMYQNGGPILMAQVENEYGSYDAHDKKYMAFLRDLLRKHLGDETVLYTTDGDGDDYLKGGYVEGTLTTVDFGLANEAEVRNAFERQQNYSEGGPNVNSEFYPGWFTQWGHAMPEYSRPEQIVATMDAMYRANASFSIYLFHGGTNFGFWNGAEYNGAIATSYDYRAPVSENGDITENYLAIQKWIGSLDDWDQKPLETPKNNSVRAYGNVNLQKVEGLLMAFNGAPAKCHNSVMPLSFEDIDHPYGFVLYRTVLEFSGTNLTAANLKDHGYVYLNKAHQGVIIDNYGTYSKKSIDLANAKKGDLLTIIVENRGRQTYESILDRKGLFDVKLDGQIVSNWTQCSIDTGPTSHLLRHSSRTLKKALIKSALAEPFELSDTSGVYVGSFSIEGEITDTWFHPGQFRKGQLFINGNNLGRYWTAAGPQITLYVPAPMLKKKNSVVLVELLGSDPTSKVSFVDAPIFLSGAGSPETSLKNRNRRRQTNL